MSRNQGVAHRKNVGAPTFSNLRSSDATGVGWNARACSCFYGANRKCQVSVIAAFAESRKRRQAAGLQNVGAPTFLASLSAVHP
jgi:hypothetical protein